ncbi:MAG: autotransporter outer membrane beta-barrel domain-containing protein [Terrimicrobiaceae bacterium]
MDLTSNNFSAAIFGTWRPGKFSFTGLLGYTCFSYESTRQIEFGTPQAGYVDRTANAEWVAHGLTGAVEATYTWSVGPVNLIPEAMLATAWQFQPAITESGANSLDLAIDPSTVGSLIGGLGIAIEVPIKVTRSIVLTPKIRAAWEHDFLGDDDQDHEVNASFANVPEPGSLTVLGQNRGSDELSLSGAIEIAVNDRWAFYGGFEWADWTNGTEITYGGGLRCSW